MLTREEPMKSAPTFFAPGERLARAELAPMVKRVIEDPVVLAILRSIPGSVLILNKERQILAANQEILDALGLKESDKLIGDRPGEIFGCIHAGEGPSGCGTSHHCRVCGAVIAMLAALEKQEPFKGECTLSLMSGERLHCHNYSVYAVPLEIAGERCLELIFHDISDKKMREAMDRIFLHDLRNAVTGLYGWSELMTLRGSDNHDADQIMKISKSLTEMIEAQGCILHAESGELSPVLCDVSVDMLLTALEEAVEGSNFAKRGSLLVMPTQKGQILYTDCGLLSRVLFNMVKNAFEAIKNGQQVTVNFKIAEDERPTFTVHNPGVIPEDTQLRIFQRAFSTKGGVGRGFGTYGMKLLGQNVLKGEVGFTSLPETGTTFYIKLPKTPVY